MKLKILLEGIFPGNVEERFLNWDITAISTDSRKIKPDALFIALKGRSFNGVDFIEKAIALGAKVIISDIKISEQNKKDHICYLESDKLDSLLRQLTLRFYDNPSLKVKVVGITGTNGKTTVSYLMEAICQKNNQSCGVIGTVNYRLGEEIQPSYNTTPSLVENQQLLFQMHDKGADYCVMEISSHALDQGRSDLIQFSSAIFTNLTSDHLDYHQTREKYFLAKSLLFTHLSTEAYAVINIDDPYGQKLVSKTPARVISYGIDNNAQVKAADIEISISGNKFKLMTPQGERTVRSHLIGRYNVYNVLAAVACGLAQEFSFGKIVEAVEQFSSVPGRLEKVDYKQPFSIFIDFAHTQDALENVLRTIRLATDKRIILVFGCGGDRDKIKRPLMGKVACQLADYSIVTSDNPRGEDPQVIMEEIIQGFEQVNYEAMVDRKQAIGKALKMAQKGDVIIIAGKGHEDYQIFKDTTVKFNERQIIREFLLC